MKTATISQEVYDQKLKQATMLQPIRKTVPLGDIEILNTGVMEVGGAKIPMSKKAFSQLAKILGVPIQFQGRVDKYFGEDASRAIVNKMKSALILQGMSRITVIANPINKEVVGFIKKENEYISNSTFFGIANDIISDHNLSVRNFYINPEDGSVNLNCFSPDKEFNVAGLKDEFFNGGITISNSIDKGLIVSPYLNRLVCLNGMIGESFNESYHLKSIQETEMEKFRKHLISLEKRNYKPMGFEERVTKSIITSASFAEIESAAELIMGQSGAKPEEIEQWVPYNTTSNEFLKFGLPVIKMTEGQKKNAKTGTSVWDLVNGLTHFSTHNSIFKVSDSSRNLIQKEAGSIIAGKFDMENQIASPF